MKIRWQSKTGRWWVELKHLSDHAYSYQSNGGSGGVFYVVSDEAAITHVQTLVDKGLFQPDANKTPMQRVA